MRRALVVALTLASAALAQTIPTADLEQQWLDPAARGSLLVGNGLLLERLQFRVGAALTYTYANFRTYGAPSQAPLISDRLGVQVTGAVGLTDWLEVSANVPVLFAQYGQRRFGAASAGLGNPFLSAKVGLLDNNKPVALSFGLGVGVPVGTGAAQGNGGIEVAPRLTAGKVFNDWQFGVELAGLVRPTADYSTITGERADKVGSQLSLSGMVSSVSTAGPRGEASVRAFVPLTGGRVGLEAQLGVRWMMSDVELFASIGPGFFGEPSTPVFRGYLGAAFGNAGLTQPPCVEGRPYELAACPDLDRDGDGVKNGLDKAPLEPEDKDAFEDDDGVPDPDNDGDGVEDAKDRCVNERGPMENGGCPDTDADKDGVVDRLDKCVNEAEDKDAFEDEDGCPELDNDGDAITDEKDACPLEKGIPEEKGCPPKDSDGDEVFDFQDNCPAEKGVKDNQGCPAAVKQLVVITREQLKILDKVFFDTGKATIQKRSNLLLDQIANVLNGHPEITLVQVEGHTDTVGKPENNKKLSQDRADSVRAYLVKKGVAEGRLKAVGFGQEKPADTNDTPAGREVNRRVEFNIVAQ